MEQYVHESVKEHFLSQMACNSEVKASVFLLANSYVPVSPPSHNQGDPLSQRLSQVTAEWEGKGQPSFWKNSIFIQLINF